MAPYWCVARSEQNREATAASFLGRSGFGVYLPRVREERRNHSRRIVVTPALFPNYLFVRVEAGWWNARWCIGVAALIMSGNEPAKVADAVIAELQSRERDGLVELPEPPRLRPGDPVKVISGLFCGASGLFCGMKSGDRVAVLLTFLGAQRATVLPSASIEAIR
jgi:transcription antitermination factor NusG